MFRLPTNKVFKTDLEKVPVVVSDLLAFGDGGGGPEEDYGAVVVPHRVRHAAVIAQTHGRINGTSQVTVLEEIF